MAWSCAALVFAVMALWVSGATAPQLRWGFHGPFIGTRVDDNGVLSIRLDIRLDNESMVPVTLTGISMDIPGFRLLPVDQAEDEQAEITVDAGERETFIRGLVVTDCAAVPREPRPIRFTYRTWLGAGESEVTMGSWPEEGAQEGQEILVAWQRALANKACDDALRSW